MSLDHGELNLPLSKRYGKGGIDAELDRYKAAELREARRERRRMAQERKAARAAGQERPKFTAETLAEATHVRDRFGWHRVVRVNAKSVTVATGHSWDDRMALDRVLEAVIDGKQVKP